MKFIQAFRMSMKSIWEKKLRSFLTMLGIIIGVAAVMTLVSVVSANSRITEENIKAQGTNIMYVSMWSSSRTFAADLEDFILRNPKLYLGISPDEMDWQRPIKYRAKTHDTAILTYANADYALCNNVQLEAGRDLSDMDVTKRNRVVVIGSSVKDKLFNYKDPIGEKVTIGQYTFTVVGVYGKRQGGYEYQDVNDFYVAPYTVKQMIMKDQRISQYRVKVQDDVPIDDARLKLESFMNVYLNGNNYYVYADNTYADMVNEEVERSKNIMAIIGGISLLVGGIGIMNIMLVTVTERTREIGIRKAIGAERLSVVAQFLIESSLISACGGLFGVVIGTLTTLIAGKMMLNQIVFPDVFATVGAVAISVILGIAFGIYPAAKASRLQPVDALRFE